MHNSKYIFAGLRRPLLLHDDDHYCIRRVTDRAGGDSSFLSHLLPACLPARLGCCLLPSSRQERRGRIDDDEDHDAGIGFKQVASALPLAHTSCSHLPVCVCEERGRLASRERVCVCARGGRLSRSFFPASL